MVRFKKIFVIITMSLFGSISSCDKIYECLFNINPEIHDKTLITAMVGERYYEIITAEINNEVHDDDYDYEFDIIGELPPGIYHDNNRRSVEFFGTPTQTGTYTFEVDLFVVYKRNPYDRSPTCKEFTSNTFTITVE